MTPAFYALLYWVKDFPEGRQTLELLLSRGADLNAAMKAGHTLLVVALTEERPNLARYLLEKGIDPNRHGPEGIPLAIAASHGDVPLVKLLLAKKANPNAKTSQGLTALKIATLQKHAEVIQILKAAGTKL